MLPDATALHTSHRTNGTNIDSVLAQTWIHGHGNHPAEPTNHLPDAPTYPFERNRYWLMTPPPATAGGTTHPHLTTAVHRADIDGTLHTGTLNPAVHTWLTEHVIGDTTLLPATAFAEMAIFAGDAVGYGRIEELTLRAPLPLDRTAALQVWVGEPDHQDRRPITVYARPTSTGSDEVWTCHATGHLGPDVDPPLPDTAPRPPAGAVAVDVDDLYERLEERGYRYGANFRRLTAAWRDGETIFAEVTVGKDTDLRGYGVHPALFDAALHCLGVTDDGAGRRLPVQWSGVSLHATGARSLRVRVTPAGDDEVAITITDPAGAPVLSVDALTLREVAGQETATSGLYTLVWKPVDGGRRGVVPGTVLLDAGAVPADRPGAAVAWVLEQVQQRLDGSEHLVVVTRGAVAVTDTDDPDPDQGAVWGLIRSAQAEHPHRFTLLDTDQPHLPDPTTLTHHTELALRNNTLHTTHLTPHTPTTTTTPTLTGTILITGGTGALGTITTRHLATHHPHLHLVLASRQGTNAPTAPELTTLGADIRTCDITDPHQLQQLINTLPNLTAVIHTAGTLHDTPYTNSPPTTSTTPSKSKPTPPTTSTNSPKTTTSPTSSPTAASPAPSATPAKPPTPPPTPTSTPSPPTDTTTTNPPPPSPGDPGTSPPA
ncbi:hypothetical protein GCM10027605_12100 [Micromonospora zhanjiangensis]